MTLGQMAKRALAAVGVQVYSRAHLPPGIQLERDLERIFGAEARVTLFDVGANVGQTARRLLAVLPHAEIWSFEPIAATFASFAQNVRGDPRIKPQRLAVGDRDGETDMLILEQSAWSRVAPNQRSVPAGQALERVKITSVDSFCGRENIRHIHLLKSDAEGHDFEVVRGAEAMLAAGNISAVLCEVNFRRDGVHGDFFAIHDWLADHGFYFYALYDYDGWGCNFASGSYQNALWLRLPDDARHPTAPQLSGGGKT